MPTKEEVNFLKKQLEPRGVRLYQLPSLLLGDVVRGFTDRQGRASDGPISRDPEQNRRSISFGNKSVIIAIGATIAGIVSYQSTQEAYQKTRECSIESISEAGFTAENPPTLRQAELTIMECVPADVRNSQTVADEAQSALDQMGIVIEYGNN